MWNFYRNIAKETTVSIWFPVKFNSNAWKIYIPLSTMKWFIDFKLFPTSADQELKIKIHYHTTNIWYILLKLCNPRDFSRKKKIEETRERKFAQFQRFSARKVIAEALNTFPGAVTPFQNKHHDFRSLRLGISWYF